MRAPRLLTCTLLGFALLIAQRGEAAPTIAITPASPINCGGPKVGQSSTKMVTVANAGDAQLSVQNLVISGPNAAEFVAQPPAFPVKLAPGTSFTFPLVFTPQATGSRTAVMTVTSNDPNTPSSAVNLVGTSGNPMISVDTGTAAYGNQRVNTSSMPQIVTITNSGFGDLNITSLTLAGADPNDFVLVKMALPGIISPMANGLFSVVFKPTALGARAAQVVISSNDQQSPTKFVNVQGTGTQAMVSSSPKSIDFGDAKIFNASMPKVVTLTNAGGDNANVTALMFSGANGNFFALSVPPTLPAKVPAMGGTLAINVVALPLALGAGAGTLTIMTDDPQTPMFTVALTCNGVGGSITATPNFVDFGVVAVNGTSPTVSVSVNNTGTDVLSILNVLENGDNPDVFTITGIPMVFPVTIMPKSNLMMSVVFKPVVAMNHNASIDITTDDPKAKLLKIPLDGVGGMPGMTTVSPTVIDFGVIPAGTTGGPSSFSINNGGGTPAMVTSVTLGGTSPGAFAIDQMGPFSVAGMMSEKVNVTFTPQTSGVQTATVSVSVVGMANPILVSLRGTGASAQVGLAPTALDFSSVTVGTTSKPSTVGIKNGGNLPIMVAGITASDPQFTIDHSASNFSLAPQATTTFNVSFTPTAAGPASATISISIVGDGNPHSVAATGIGVGPNTRRSNPGGCSTGGHARSTWPLALLVLAGLLVARRRSRF